jgi:hypothetical protein
MATSTPNGSGKFDVTLTANLTNLGQSLAKNVQVRFAYSQDGVIFQNIGPTFSVGDIFAGGSQIATRVWSNVGANTYLITCHG